MAKPENDDGVYFCDTHQSVIGLLPVEHAHVFVCLLACSRVAIDDACLPFYVAV